MTTENMMAGHETAPALRVKNTAWLSISTNVPAVARAWSPVQRKTMFPLEPDQTDKERTITWMRLYKITNGKEISAYRGELFSPALYAL
jgi:hypothetical protein